MVTAKIKLSGCLSDRVLVLAHVEQLAHPASVVVLHAREGERDVRPERNVRAVPHLCRENQCPASRLLTAPKHI